MITGINNGSLEGSACYGRTGLFVLKSDHGRMKLILGALGALCMKVNKCKKQMC
ncbi:hypothetical protein BLL52_0004 [Rhodoferax antarcticus ANT.BR]|uniref:Uncharacterized protein n=1 Tax=Rhodoferax antarcticus ANT.BR TaxID=1111071 RepID=A0A1Q8YK10_9BURK|nr:hypothetical protein BLL52_0004 [Rhodoferax antarcticus ANT.BR]